METSDRLAELETRLRRLEDREAIHQLFMRYRQCLDEGVGWPAVHAEADYLRQVRFGDDLVIAVEIERLGRSSATFVYTGTRGGDDGPAVTGKIVVACIDMTTMRSQEIPPKYRALFEKHLRK